MANPEVSRLIDELSSILEQNRQKRNAADAMLMGIQQGHAAAQARMAQGAAANGAAAGRGAYEAGKKAGAPGPSETSYGGDESISPYSRTGGAPQVSARALSPSTGREGRLRLGEDYARTQSLLNENPYRLQENAPAYQPNTDPALEEQKKRFTQNLMMQRGETGGPLGGAGQGPQAAAIEAAGNPDLGNFGNITRDTFRGAPQGPAQAQQAGTAPPAGWSEKDYALLNALAHRYPGG